MIRGNTSDFMCHPVGKDSISDPHMGPPTTPGPRPPTTWIRRWARTVSRDLYWEKRVYIGLTSYVYLKVLRQYFAAVQNLFHDVYHRLMT